MWKEFEESIVLIASIRVVDALTDSLESTGYQYATNRDEDRATLWIPL